MLLAVSPLTIAACGSPTASAPPSREAKLTSVACKDIASVMASKQGTATITWNESDPSQSPLQEMTAAVHRSANAKLHTEVAAFEAAAKAGNGLRAVDEANALVQTCRRLGLGTKSTSQT